MEDLTPEQVRRVLGGSWLGHLGLARDGHAYVLPVFYAYDGRHVYFHSLPGTKDAFIAGTVEACLAVTRVGSEDHWDSVLVFGPVEPVALASDQLVAMDALLGLPLPPAPGTSPETGEPRRSAQGMRMWRLVPRRATGRRSEPPPAPGVV
jgi:uncharacterized protein